jgi:hypothetical protein
VFLQFESDHDSPTKQTTLLFLTLSFLKNSISTARLPQHRHIEAAYRIGPRMDAGWPGS